MECHHQHWQSPPPPSNASWQEKTFYLISKQMLDIQNFNDQTQQRTLSLQKAAAESKRTRDSAMSLQTKDPVRTTRVLLMDLASYEGTNIIVNELPFSTTMLDLTERPGTISITNQVTQLTRKFSCSPNLSLWVRMLKVHGLVAPDGLMAGGFHVGFSSWDSPPYQSPKTSSGSKQQKIWRVKEKCHLRIFTSSLAVTSAQNQR